MPDITIRPADQRDIDHVIDLLDIATYGFVPHVFRTLSPEGADVRQVIRQRLENPDSQMSLTKTRMAETDGAVAGFVMCETLPDPAEILTPDTPGILRPLLELESLAPGTTLVNFVATYP